MLDNKYPYISKPFVLHSKATYTSCYCEENIYKLAEEFEKSLKSLSNENNFLQIQGYAIFVTNEEKQTFIKQQKIGTRWENMVVWDYHVIFIVKIIDNTNPKTPKQISCIYDLDT